MRRVTDQTWTFTPILVIAGGNTVSDEAISVVDPFLIGKGSSLAHRACRAHLASAS